MIIISDFVDYYDGCMNLISSIPSLVYIRKKRLAPVSSVLEMKRIIDTRFVKTHSNKIVDPDCIVSSFFVGVCGQFYPGVRIESPLGVEVSYTIKGCEYLSSRLEVSLSESILSSLTNHLTLQYSDTSLFESLNTPLLLIYPNLYSCDIHIDPCLMDVTYVKRSSASSLFMRIQSFIEIHLETVSDGPMIIHGQKETNISWCKEKYSKYMLT